MGSAVLLSNHKISRLFLELVRGRARPAKLARRCGLERAECDRLVGRMVRGGLIQPVAGGSLDVDWERFVPLFISQAMNLYAAAMPWKYVTYYMQRDPGTGIEAACARSERELARVKVRLAGNDRFLQLVQALFRSLATEVDAPEDYLADLRIQDAVDEFEYALVKLYPQLKRSKARDPSTRELLRLLGDWYRRVQAYDNTPTGSALRSALQKLSLLPPA